MRLVFVGDVHGRLDASGQVERSSLAVLDTERGALELVDDDLVGSLDRTLRFPELVAAFAREGWA